MSLLPIPVLEPMWAALDWLLKMVYSSSLMETNFFVAQVRLVGWSLAKFKGSDLEFQFEDSDLEFKSVGASGAA